MQLLATLVHGAALSALIRACKRCLSLRWGIIDAGIGSAAIPVRRQGLFNDSDGRTGNASKHAQIEKTLPDKGFGC